MIKTMAEQKIVRIGGACAFYGDSSVAPPQLIKAGVDYLILDYLAEVTMALLGKMQAANPASGYAFDFTEWVWKDNLPAIVRSGVKIITNAGGVNPHACRERMEAIAAKQGLSLRIAVVDGDDLRSRLAEFKSAAATEMFTGESFPDPAQVITANAYLGAFPIAQALAMGADVVITGRVVDSALTLGPLIHEFGWQPDDYHLLAAGSLAGHVIECGAQATGGLFTDWRRVPDWAHIGYPIIECAADGSFIVTKPEGTGGLVEPAAVAEQMMYEIGDPQAYMLPDVVCDFSAVKMEEAGQDRVRVSGAIGYPSTGRYKVSISYDDGRRCFGLMPVVGREAAAKAQRQAEAILSRVEELLQAKNLPPFRAKRIELIGTEASYGANARIGDIREVLCKIGVEHEDERAFRIFLREFDAYITSMSVGSTGWHCGRPRVMAVMRVFSITVDPQTIRQCVSLDGHNKDVPVALPPQPFKPEMIIRPLPAKEAPDVECSAKVPLIDLAWARSGDKGDSFNVAVIARRPEYLPYLRASLTEAAVFQYFAHEFEGAKCPCVTRFEVPGISALNFLCEQALGGGQLASLRLDPLAKGKAQQLLDFPVAVPSSLAAALGH